MKRVDTASAAAALPGYAAGPGPVPGYFDEGAPGVADGTIPGQDHFNHVQEELVNAIIDDGDSLDGLDDTQLAERLEPLKGIIADAAATPTTPTWKRVCIASTIANATGLNSAALASAAGTASGAESAVIASGGAASRAQGQRSAVIASLTSQADGVESAVIASDGGAATGENSAVIASVEGAGTLQATGDQAAVIASGDGQVTGDKSAVIASDTSTVTGDKSAAIASDASTVSSNEAAVIATQSTTASGINSFAAACNASLAAGVRSAVLTSGTRAIASGPETLLVSSSDAELYTTGIGGGDTGVGIAAAPTFGDQELTWKITTQDTDNADADANPLTGGGDIYSDGTVGAGLADFAEMFENFTQGERIPDGSILALDGDKTREAKTGDNILGIVSIRPTVLGNNQSMAHESRHVRDDWGRYVTERVDWVSWPELRSDVKREIVLEGYHGPLSDAPVEPPEGAVVYERPAKTRIQIDTGKPDAVSALRSVASRMPAPVRRALEKRIRSIEPTFRTIKEPITWVRWGPVIRKTPGEVIRERYNGRADKAPITIPEDAITTSRLVRIRSESFDATRVYLPRSARPKEWTKVGLVGQLRTRVDSTVDPGDYVAPGSTPGRGTRAKKHTKIRCMRMVSPYDSDRGYAIAWCLIT